jgi:hypothetical protein
MLASQSMRDPDLIEQYATKYQMKRNDISLLFKDPN